ncbi:antistasin-like isoform X1 [Littorina saxatilis]|uniref:antistasin-like isoform X1 n=1 Tax=Littorina saxatilis TaxID=31220 RepID=UPI0038B585ED
MEGKQLIVCCVALLGVCIAVCQGDGDPDPRQLEDSLPPVQGCPVCTEYCRYGRELGSNGCLSCQCRKEASHFKEAPIYGRPLIHPSPYQQRSQCPPLLCKNYCDFGRVKTVDGCDTCKCNSDPSFQAPVGRQLPCPTSRCKNFCFFGRTQDTRGCDTCRCRSRTVPSVQAPVGRQLPCPTSRCKNFCFFGRAQDTRGCDTCRCRSRTDTDGRAGFSQLRNIQGPSQVQCPQLRCSNFCRSGFWAVDSQGCPTCNCQQSSFFFRG